MVSIATAQDEGGEHTPAIVLHREASLSFAPEAVLFFIEWDSGKVDVERGYLIEPLTSKEDETTTRGIWRGIVRVPWKLSESALKLSALFLHKGGQHFLLGPEYWLLRERVETRAYPDELREYLIEEKEELGELSKMLEKEEGQVKRLKSDAEIIGSFSHAGQSSKRKELIEDELIGVREQVKRLRGFLKHASREPKPQHFSVRKRELSQQVRELAEKAKQAESTEKARGEESKLDLIRKQDLIEEMRYEDVVFLREELRRLEEKRERLQIEQLPVRAVPTPLRTP